MTYARLILFIILVLWHANASSQPKGETVVAGAMVYDYQGLEDGASGDLELAKRKFEIALSYMPFYARSIVNLQICDDALEGRISRRSAVLLFTSLNDFSKRDSASVLKLTASAIKANPDYTPAYLVRAGIYFSLKNHEKAKADYQQAIHFTPDSYISHFLRGSFWLALQEHQNAIADFSESIKLENLYAPAYLERGIAFAEINKNEKAIQDFEVALAAWPKWQKHFKIFGAYLNRGIERRQQGNYLGAIADLDKAVSLNPKFAESFLNRGLAYYELSDFSQAKADFDTAIKLDPSAEAHYGRAETLQRRRQFDLAIKDYTRTISLQPGHVMAHFRLAELYRRLELFEKSVEEFDSVIELEPENYWAYYRKAVVLDKLKDYKAAIASYTQFLQKTPAEHTNHKTFARERIKKLNRVIK